MAPMQFEYTTSELFGNVFPYWPHYILTIRYTTDGNDITVIGAEIDTGAYQCCAAHTLYNDMARYYRDALIQHADATIGQLTEAQPCTDTN
jgi:hypothetical protein